MSNSPTSRSLAECRKRGWTAQVVEHWNPHAHIRQDLFGVIDIVALIPPEDRIGGACCVYKAPFDRATRWTCQSCGVICGPVPGTGGILAIQACAGSSHANRMTKIRAELKTHSWLQAGGKFEVWSWAKQGARGKRKIWTLRVEQVKP